MVGPAPPPSDSKWQTGLYWLYVTLLATTSIFWLAIASPIIRPTLPSSPQNIFFCIFAGIAIADAAAHAISDIAGIWKPHDLGLAQAPRRKFSARKLFIADLKRLLSHLSALPIVAMMAYSYTLLSPAIEARLFGPEAAQGFGFWNFISQTIMGGADVFGFFLSQDNKATLQESLNLVELQPRSFEAGAILAGLKLYGVLVLGSALRLLGAPIVIFRTWLSSRKKPKRKSGAK
ncbi:MAG: hypothetical protein Q8R82_06505 [Hyphomonadaceae bacterium]|nr:hypothetical protein [Hyphomonadaceae bacterium]